MTMVTVETMVKIDEDAREKLLRVRDQRGIEFLTLSMHVGKDVVAHALAGAPVDELSKKKIEAWVREFVEVREL